VDGDVLAPLPFVLGRIDSLSEGSTGAMPFLGRREVVSVGPEVSLAVIL